VSQHDPEPDDSHEEQQHQYPDHRTEYIQSPKRIGTRKLATKWGIPYRTISEQCTKEGWVAQREQFQGKVRAESEKEAAETLAEAKARWAKEYRALQATGLKALRELEPKTAGEAARLLDIGIKGEMLQREGEPDHPHVIIEYVLSERSPEEKAQILRDHPELADELGWGDVLPEPKALPEPQDDRPRLKGRVVQDDSQESG
jgi:hypothetical protein